MLNALTELLKQVEWDGYLQLLGFGILGNILILIYGKLIGRFDKVLLGVLVGVLWGVLVGVLGGVLGDD